MNSSMPRAAGAQDRPPCAVTHTAWINAWTLREACRRLGVALVTTAAQRELPLPRTAASRAQDWLLFTEERSLQRALAGELVGRFLPTQFPAALLDDKFAFAAWLAEPDPTLRVSLQASAPGWQQVLPQGLPQWPLEQAAQARFPVLLKARHSWRGDQKLPRGWVCRDAAELAAALAALPAQGLRPEWFFLQAWLGDAPLRLLSVGGFFDAEDEARNLACVTDRVQAYGEGLSSSAMLVTVPDKLGLVAQSQAVLRRLRYRGPYEMEFVAVEGGPCLVLELNPRLWMQHGIFLASGNGLVERCLGMDKPGDRAGPPPPGLLWVDGVWLWRHLLRLQGRALRVLSMSTRRRVVCPSLSAVAAAAVWRLAVRLGWGRR